VEDGASPRRPSISNVIDVVSRIPRQLAPAMLLEGSQGGHDYPDEYTQTADMAMQMSFFIDTLMKH
jgi:hypothetical protein